MPKFTFLDHGRTFGHFCAIPRTDLPLYFNNTYYIMAADICFNREMQSAAAAHQLCSEGNSKADGLQQV